MQRPSRREVFSSLQCRSYFLYAEREVIVLLASLESQALLARKRKLILAIGKREVYHALNRRANRFLEELIGALPHIPGRSPRHDEHIDREP